MSIGIAEFEKLEVQTNPEEQDDFDKDFLRNLCDCSVTGWFRDQDPYVIQISVGYGDDWAWWRLNLMEMAKGYYGHMSQGDERMDAEESAEAMKTVKALREVADFIESLCYADLKVA